MKATILTIGDELLIGQIIDTNAAWISEQLTTLGITVVERMTCADEKDAIIRSMDYGLSQSNIILMTGGLGPTKDDITKEAIAEYLGVKMEFDEGTFQRIKDIFEPRNIPVTEAHRLQCCLPQSVTILPNSMGTAPGMLFHKGDKAIVSMPGVPYEMKAIMNEQLLPRLSDADTRRVILHRTICTAGVGESQIADAIADAVDAFPVELSMSYLPSIASVRLRITARGDDSLDLQHKVDIASQEVEHRLGDIVYGYDKTTLIQSVQNLCVREGLTVGTAESCTGGYLSHLITSEPGSSGYYQGSIVSYSNTLKQKLLGVKEETLRTHGAVSEPVVKQMVQGALRQLDVDIVMALSGVAGPTGGTNEKPVGTVCIAVGDQDRIVSKTILASKDRSKNIKYASNHALIMLRKFIRER